MDRVTSYHDDIYAWSQEQASALRRLAAIRRDLPNELDLEHVAEEIEDLGKSEIRTVESFIELLLQHLVKLASVPGAPPARHWRDEIVIQQRGARDDFKPSMAQSIRLERIWDAARRRADAALDQYGETVLPSLPAVCPFSLNDLLAEPFDIDAAADRLRQNALISGGSAP